MMLMAIIIELYFGLIVKGKIMANTSKAIRELLERKNIVPTGDAAEDMKLAKSVMPAPYNKQKESTNGK